MERLCSIGFALTVALGVAGLAAMALTSAKLEVAGQWVDPTARTSDVHHGYFTLTNRGPDSRRVVAVESPFYARATVYGGPSLRQADLVVEPGRHLVFGPEGPFARLSDPSERMPSDGAIPLVLVFANGERVPFRAPFDTMTTATIREAAQADRRLPEDHGL